jgi:Delta7-sterol 5-desaturase
MLNDFIVNWLWKWLLLGEQMSDPSLFSVISQKYFLSMARIFLMASIFLTIKQVIPQIRVKQPERKSGDLNRELFYTFVGLASVAIFTTLIISYLGPKGLVKFYNNKNDFGLFYYYLSYPIALLGLDAYFYSTHRLFHLKWVYNKIHYTHHLSIHTTPFTGTSFHPIEFVILYSYHVILSMIIPIHIDVLNFVSWITFIHSALAHSGIDPFPVSFRNHPILSLWNTPTHHHLHHIVGHGNYSLYFNFWDRILKTNNNAKI